MKKVYLSLLSLFSVLAVNAQLTQANHAPAIGDMYTMFQCDTVSPGASGANSVWNYSSINTHSSVVSNYTAMASSPTYTAATVAVAASANNTSYYNPTSTALLYYGGNISVGGGATAVKATLTYSAPAVYGSYPMSLNTTSAATIGGSLVVTSPLSTSGTFNGSSNVLADGTGTLMLPGAVTLTNVIRVVTSQTINFTTSFASGSVVQINYEFYQVGTKNPMFSVSTSTATTPLGTTTQTLVNRNKDASSTPTSTTTVSIKELAGDNSNFTVYPNPTNGSVTFATNHPDAKQVSIYDITGKLVEKQLLNDGKIKVDVSSYNKGLYLYTISSGDNTSLKSGKITVSQ